MVERTSIVHRRLLHIRETEEMIKYFCDTCGIEINDSNRFSGGQSAEMKRNGVKLKVTLIAHKDGISNAGDFCKYCVIAAVNMLDDRPKMA